MHIQTSATPAKSRTREHDDDLAIVSAVVFLALLGVIWGVVAGVVWALTP